MKKFFKSRVFIVIITMLICISGTLYATNTYKAREISYTSSNGETTNVNEVLNEIYNIKTLGDATSEDILEGKTAIVQGKMITGTLNNSYVTTDIGSFSGTTNASGVITKTIYAKDLGMSKIIGLTTAGIEENIQTVGHNLRIKVSNDGASAVLTCYMSYGGQPITCYAVIIGITE